MPQYRRQTTSGTIDQLQPELTRSLHAYFEAQQLTSLANEVLACCETLTMQVGASWYDALLRGKFETQSQLALVLTPQRLIWARSSDQAAPTVASATFADMQVKVFRPRNTQDFALQINLRMTGSKWATVNGQLLLGPEPAAEKFCIALGQAMGFDLMAPPPKPWWDRLFTR